MMTATDAVEILYSSARERWNHWFRTLPLRLQDVNYSFDYQHLYEANGDGRICLFVYAVQQDVFYYPFLLRPVNNRAAGEGYRDIESVYGYTGPLCTTGDRVFRTAAVEAFYRFCLEQKVVCEFIRFHPLLNTAGDAKSDKGLSIVPLRDYVYVDLEPAPELLWNSYSSQNRNKIRKAEKNGVVVVCDTDLSHFDEFVRIYLDNMRQLKAARMYFFCDAFFRQLKTLVSTGGALLVAKKNETILGASVFLGGETIGHYFLSSATEEGKRLAVSNLMLHRGILWSRRQGMKKLHLGGGVTAADNDPLLVFKKNFSQLTEKFCIGKRILDPSAYELLVKDWDHRFPEEAPKYKTILQRYRWEKEDLL